MPPRRSASSFSDCCIRRSTTAKPKGDGDALAAAAKIFRAKSEALNGGADEAQQMIGSSVSFYDGLTVKQLSKSAGLCLAAQKKKFVEDD